MAIHAILLVEGTYLLLSLSSDECIIHLNLATFMYNLHLFFSDNICLSNEKCIRGICRVVCNSDEACNEGHICENRICKQGCRDDNACDENQACLNGQCKGKKHLREV